MFLPWAGILTSPIRSISLQQEENMEITQWVVVVGSVGDGFSHYGPFDDHDAALRFADTMIGNWEVIPLLNPPEGIAAFVAAEEAPAAEAQA
jgi:hypothetical protein